MTKVATFLRSPMCCVVSKSKHRRTTSRKGQTSLRRKFLWSSRSPLRLSASTKFKRPRQLCRMRMGLPVHHLIQSSPKARSTPRKLPRVSATTPEANTRLNRTTWCLRSRQWSSRLLIQSPSARKRKTWSPLLPRSNTQFSRTNSSRSSSKR